MEKQTIHISPDMTPRNGGGPKKRPSGSKRPLTEAERRRRIALKKKRKRQRMIRRAIMISIIAVLILILLLVVHLVKNRAETLKEPELVEVQEFIGLSDADGNAAGVTAFGTYGTWLRLSGSFLPSAGKSVSGVAIELHDAYKTKLVPWEEAFPEEAALKAAEEEEEKGFFDTLFSAKKEETETETETESETEEVLLDKSGQAAYPMQFAADETGAVIFTTSEDINGGISLDSMLSGDYTVLLRADYADGTSERFTLADLSGMAPVDYYTITRDGANDEVTLAFSMDETGTQPYLLYGKQSAALPAEVYDFAIDAGHGGKDPGASNDQITEAELTLAYAKGLYEKLTEMGYKVILTRDGTESPSADMAYTMYDPDGRVNIACGSHAKLCISIHFNSNKEVTKGGLEVYCSGRGNPELAGLIADTVVEESGTTYSNQKSYKVQDGVYVKTMTEEDIASSASKAANNNFEPYNLTTDTDTLFMIREFGGIWTNAYIDGRNPYFGTNLYKDSNMGVESYLIEIAFMSVPSDIQNAVSNADAYEQGIADAMDTWARALPGGGYASETIPAVQEETTAAEPDGTAEEPAGGGAP